MIDKMSIVSRFGTRENTISAVGGNSLIGRASLPLAVGGRQPVETRPNNELGDNMLVFHRANTKM